MKMIGTTKWLAAAVFALTATTALRVAADGPATAPQPEKHYQTYTGTVISVNPNEHVVNVSGWLGWLKLHKAFNLGENCDYTQLGKNPASAADLHPGEKVTVSYQDVDGVLIANRVTQEAMRYEGMVKAVDASHRTLTLHGTAWDKKLTFPADCQIVLRDGKAGTAADIQVGNHVTVTYETPDDTPTARVIAQTSITFTGALTALDLEARTVKAKRAFATKKFNLADNCAIVINGKPDGRLADLRPDEDLVFSYDKINGINVVNRIAPASAQPATVAAAAPVQPN